MNYIRSTCRDCGHVEQKPREVTDLHARSNDVQAQGRGPQGVRGLFPERSASSVVHS